MFDGEGTPNDVHDLATKYGCDVVVLVPQDKAWDHDPFAAGPDYRLAEARDGRWRIYVREIVTSGKHESRRSSTKTLRFRRDGSIGVALGRRYVITTL